MIDPDLQPAPILQERLVDVPWQSAATARLPGTVPVANGDWLRVDDAYSAQMVLRDRVLRLRTDDVHVLRNGARDAAQELLSEVLSLLSEHPDFGVSDDHVLRPDGKWVALDPDNPLMTLGRLVQQDFCILQNTGTEHVLTGAVLCFPASWTLAEKIDRPLSGIHATVPVYTDDIARRVQRMFNGVQVGRALWRVNLLVYAKADLFQPRCVGDPRADDPQDPGGFIRSERQCISRLSRSGAIVFSIHTTVVSRASLTRVEHAAMTRHLAEIAAH